MAARIAGIALILAAIFASAAAATEPTAKPDTSAVTQDELRAAIDKSLPLLMKAAIGHREQRKQCFACHQQGLPIFALTAAKAKGFTIDDAELDTQLQFIADFLGKNREQYLQGKGQGGQADTAGYALVTLAAGGWKPDEATAAVTEYLLLRQKDQDHWSNTSNRPPTEASPFTTSYVSLRGLAAFATAEQKERADNRAKQVREWVVSATPKDNEDRVFRLLAMKQVDAPQADIEAAAKELLAKQRDDGGWAQLDSYDPAKDQPEAATTSDAYATGTALVALHQAGGLATSDAAYQRGLRYLLQGQLEDGSWHVTSRSKPFQAYYESGFPHKNDQFISCAASGWATWALVLGAEKESLR
jgi:Squalene-hopene cyclase C-terminal domain